MERLEIHIMSLSVYQHTVSLSPNLPIYPATGTYAVHLFLRCSPIPEVTGAFMATIRFVKLDSRKPARWLRNGAEGHIAIVVK